MFADKVKINVIAGRGGDGGVSFRREKYEPKGGPDGGDGGDGGSIYIYGDRNLDSLSHIKNNGVYRAGVGQSGHSAKKSGKKGEDILIPAPIGTIVIELIPQNLQLTTRHSLIKSSVDSLSENALSVIASQSEAISNRLIKVRVRKLEPAKPSTISQQQLAVGNHQIIKSSNRQSPSATSHQPSTIIGEVLTENDKILVARGGKGGTGNTKFATSTNRIPLKFEYGKEGEERELFLELQIFSDIAILGLPNCGKSSLLAKLTNSKSNIADYPFATTAPTPGVLQIADLTRLTLLDLPPVPFNKKQYVATQSVVTRTVLVPTLCVGTNMKYLSFLKHLRRTKIIFFMLDISLSSISISQQLEILLNTLEKYVEKNQFLQRGDVPTLPNNRNVDTSWCRNNYIPLLTEKLFSVGINKIDLLTTRNTNKSAETEEGTLRISNDDINACTTLSGCKPILISCITGEGLEEVVDDWKTKLKY